MDDVEFAQRYAEKLVADALSRNRTDSSRPSFLLCEECEEPIPEKRRKKQPGCTRCVICQQEYEEEMKRYG